MTRHWVTPTDVTSPSCTAPVPSTPAGGRSPRATGDPPLRRAPSSTKGPLAPGRARPDGYDLRVAIPRTSGLAGTAQRVDRQVLGSTSIFPGARVRVLVTSPALGCHVHGRKPGRYPAPMDCASPCVRSSGLSWSFQFAAISATVSACSRHQRVNQSICSSGCMITVETRSMRARLISGHSGATFSFNSWGIWLV